MGGLEQAIQAFVQEAQDILTGLEEEILALEEEPSPEKVDAIFRGLHTIKGSGAMFGYTALARFTHHFENAYDLVRDGKLSIDKPLIDLSLDARDRMVVFLDSGADSPEVEALLDAPETQALVDRIQQMSGEGDAPAEAPAAQAHQDNAANPDPNADGSRRFQIRFQPDGTALRNGMRPDLLVDELLGLGEGELHIDASELPALHDLDPAQAYLTWHIAVETTNGRDAIDDVFIFADDAKIDIVDCTREPEVLTPVPVAAGAKPSAGDPAPAPQTLPKRQQSPDNIRIASTRLDDMMDNLGELVITLARLGAVADKIEDINLNTVVEDVDRLVTGLRDATLSIRMLPIEQVFGKFRRVIRDLSDELGKDVRLITFGGETEVDKNVIDRIGEPLVHMIRNSMDHGLESAEERLRAGKPEQGVVRLSARQEGGEILIVVEDNGRGLDLERIRAKAIERGLLDPEVDIPDHALRQMIFEPGFSTAQEVSSVSGRGVGMDSVRATIDALGGEVEVESRSGQGTRVTLRLPVTMAIIDGLRVQVGGSTFVIPLSSVEECVEMDPAEAARTSGRSVLQIREHLVPYLELGTVFNLSNGKAARPRVVVVRASGARIGLVVDDILGQSQAVVKGLSTFHRDLPGIGGATILGNGRVALIVDVATLVRWAETQHGTMIGKAA